MTQRKGLKAVTGADDPSLKAKRHEAARKAAAARWANYRAERQAFREAQDRGEIYRDLIGPSSVTKVR